MKKNLLILIFTAIGLFSCKPENKSAKDVKRVLDSVKNNQNKKQLALNKAIYSKYDYTDLKGKSVTIQNSLSKGGVRYTDPKKEVYVYAVFWTRIINETASPLELKIDFPVNSYEIPDLPGKYYKILIPSDTMTLEKIPLFNFGLTDLEIFFNKNIDKPAALKRTIKPKEATGFYVVTLRSVGGKQYGILRTELILREQNLFYKIRDKEIKCGSINLKDLVQKK